MLCFVGLCVRVPEVWHAGKRIRITRNFKLPNVGNWTKVHWNCSKDSQLLSHLSTLFCFWNGLLLYTWGWPRRFRVVQADLELRLSAPASQRPGLQVYASPLASDLWPLPLVRFPCTFVLLCFSLPAFCCIFHQRSFALLLLWIYLSQQLLFIPDVSRSLCEEQSLFHLYMKSGICEAHGGTSWGIQCSVILLSSFIVVPSFVPWVPRGLIRSLRDLSSPG